MIVGAYLCNPSDAHVVVAKSKGIQPKNGGWAISNDFEQDGERGAQELQSNKAPHAAYADR